MELCYPFCKIKCMYLINHNTVASIDDDFVLGCLENHPTKLCYICQSLKDEPFVTSNIQTITNDNQI